MYIPGPFCSGKLISLLYQSKKDYIASIKFKIDDFRDDDDGLPIIYKSRVKATLEEQKFSESEIRLFLGEDFEFSDTVDFYQERLKIFLFYDVMNYDS